MADTNTDIKQDFNTEYDKNVSNIKTSYGYIANELKNKNKSLDETQIKNETKTIMDSFEDDYGISIPDTIIFGDNQKSDAANQLDKILSKYIVKTENNDNKSDNSDKKDETPDNDEKSKNSEDIDNILSIYNQLKSTLDPVIKKENLNVNDIIKTTNEIYEKYKNGITKKELFIKQLLMFLVKNKNVPSLFIENDEYNPIVNAIISNALNIFNTSDKIDNKYKTDNVINDIKKSIINIFSSKTPEIANSQAKQLLINLTHDPIEAWLAINIEKAFNKINENKEDIKNEENTDKNDQDDDTIDLEQNAFDENNEFEDSINDNEENINEQKNKEDEDNTEDENNENIEDDNKPWESYKDINPKKYNEYIKNGQLRRFVDKRLAKSYAYIPPGFNAKPDESIWNEAIITEFGIPFINFNSTLVDTVIHKDKTEAKKAYKALSKELSKIKLADGIINSLRQKPIKLIKYLLTKERVPAIRNRLVADGKDLFNENNKISCFAIDGNKKNISVELNIEHIKQFYDIASPYSSAKLYSKYNSKIQRDITKKDVENMFDKLETKDGIFQKYILIPKSKPHESNFMGTTTDTPLRDTAKNIASFFGAGGGATGKRLVYTRAGDHFGAFIMPSQMATTLFRVG